MRARARSSATSSSSRERLEAEHLAAREERRVHRERRVLGRRADEGDRPVLDVRQERVLLRLVEAVDLVDEDDRALPVVARAAPRASATISRSSATLPSTALNGTKRGLRLRRDDARRASSCRRRAGPRGSSTARGRSRSRARGACPAPSEVRLADDSASVARPHALGERDGARARGLAARRGGEERARFRSPDFVRVAATRSHVGDRSTKRVYRFAALAMIATCARCSSFVASERPSRSVVRCVRARARAASTSRDRSRDRPIEARTPRRHRGRRARDSRDGVDRFTVCPPPGELGQPWIPPLPAWTRRRERRADAGAPAADRSGLHHAHEGPHATEIARRGDASRVPQLLPPRPRPRSDAGRSRRDRAARRRGRTRRAGRGVRRVRARAESIACMNGVRAASALSAAAGGHRTRSSIPACSRHATACSRTAPTHNDAYTAARVRRARSGAAGAPRVRASSAQPEGRPVQASATFTLDVDATGRSRRARRSVDGRSGLLACAAQALEALAFAAAGGRRGDVIARLTFNPRQGTR